MPDWLIDDCVIINFSIKLHNLNLTNQLKFFLSD